MNSLAFLFRQFDALAVSGRRLLPSTLTGGDTPTYNRNTDESDPILNRKQTNSSDPSLISSDGNTDSSNRNRKRSCSAPMEPKPPGISDTSKLVNLPRHTLKPHYPSLGKRIYLVRLVASLYDWLAATWSSLTRSNSEIGYTEEETEKGGQESSDEEKSYANQERPISSLSTISSSRQSPYSSIIASPLSQSVTPPTVNLIPPDSPNSSGMSEIPSPSSSQTHLPTSIRASSSVVSPNSIMSSTPNAPRSPFHLPKTLVLDLDETLIHSTTRPLSPQRSLGFGLLRGFILGKKSKGTSHMVEVVLGNKSTSYHVYKRPFTDYFLRKVRYITFCYCDLLSFFRRFQDGIRSLFLRHLCKSTRTP